MFCPKCGTQNNDNNINCANCGAPLRPAQQQQPQYNYVQPQPQYVTPARVGAKPTVLYIIAGVMAALQVLMFFLPHFTYGKKVYMPISLISDANSLNKIGAKNASSFFGGIAVCLIIVAILNAVWAILSFLKKRPAGVFGIVAGAVGFFIHVFWLALTAGADAASGISSTPFPLFMFLISIASIPVGIVQVVKKKYLD